QPDAVVAGDVLNELPGDAAAAGAAGGGPFDGHGAGFLHGDRQVEVVDVTLDHFEEIVLRAGVEADPQAEAVGEGDLVFHHVAGVDGVALLVLHDVAGNEVAAVGG